MPRRPRRGSGGFSLIETLVALVIVGLATTAIVKVFDAGLLGHRVSDAAATALSVAEDEVAMAAGQKLRPRGDEGVFAGRFHWRLAVAFYDDPQSKGAAASAQPASPLRLYRIAVTVDWLDGRHRRQVKLATLRLGPTP